MAIHPEHLKPLDDQPVRSGLERKCDIAGYVNKVNTLVKKM